LKKNGEGGKKRTKKQKKKLKREKTKERKKKRVTDGEPLRILGKKSEIRLPSVKKTKYPVSNRNPKASKKGRHGLTYQVSNNVKERLVWRDTGGLDKILKKKEGPGNIKGNLEKGGNQGKVPLNWKEKPRKW